MKKIIFFTLGLCCFMITFGQQATSKGLWVPPGATTVNGVITPPKGWTYMGINSSGGFQSMANAGVVVSCVCLNPTGGQCLPFAVGSMKGCYTDGSCSRCELSTAAKVGSQTVNISTGGFVNLNLGIKFYNNNAELPAGFDAMLLSAEVQKAFQSFLSKIYQGKAQPAPIIGADGSQTAPDGHVFALINVYGRGFTCLVPKSTSGLGFNTTKYRCDCTNGQCISKSKFGAIFCEGNCSGKCTLSAQTTWPVITSYTF